MKLVLRLLLITASATSCGLFAVDPTFHLKNNNKDSIQIDIMQNNKSLTGLQRVAKGSEFPFQLDISKPTTLEIHYCPTPDYCKTNLPIKMIAKIKAGKTIYAKFDGKTIEPQKGDILGKTTSGYSTKNNVGKGDMKVEGGGTKKSELGIGGMYKQEMPQQKTAAPTESSAAESVEVPEESALDPMETAWTLFPDANKYRLEEQIDFFGAEKKESDLAQKAVVARKVLQLPKNAPNADIARAFRKMSLPYHPDRAPANKKEEYTIAQNILSHAKDVLIQYNEKK